MELQMRNKTFISSMVGIAATVAVAGSAAQAGLTWHGYTYDQQKADRSLIVGSFGTNAYEFVDDDAAYGAATFTNAAYPGSSVTFSGLTLSGPNENSWSVTGTTTSFGEYASFLTAGFYFTVTGSQQVTIATGQYAQWSLYGGPDYDSLSLIGELPNSSPANSQTFDLSAGEYWFYGDATAGSGYSGLMMSFTVPAPGAAALLGAAGLVGARRRRA
jgi:hypothetical protein